MTNELGSQAAVAIISTYGMQWLKGQTWFPLLSYENGKLNGIVSAIVAACASVGVLVTFNSGVLTITGLTLANAGHIVSHFLTQWSFQHATYKAIVAPPQPGAVQDKERKETPQEKTS